MTINATSGLIAGRRRRGQSGSFAVTVRVTDRTAFRRRRILSVNVGAASRAARADGKLTPTVANAAQTVTLNVQVTGGNGGAITRTATLDGAPCA